ncbi:MAG: hypothetical protein MUE51_05070 [Thermoleophilia bacterium]|nr:hypothetical protein [Thermoleophilia bacterium]
MKDVIEVLVAGSWLHVEAGSFRVVKDPVGGSGQDWFEFTIGDAQHKTARGPVAALQVVLSRASEADAGPAAPAPKRAPRARRAAAPKTPAPEAAKPAPRTRRRTSAEPEAS